MSVGTCVTKQLWGAVVTEWELTGNGGGEPVRCPQYADKSYAMFGTWGGATVVLQGSWDFDNPTTWFTLNESDNTTAISNTANAAGKVLENPIWIRPLMSSAGTTDVKISCVCK